MKKIFLLIIIWLSGIIFIPNTLAINYYDNVEVTTVFDESIEIDDIKQIEIAYVDATGYTKYFILKKENNFEYTLENVPVGDDISVEYGVVDNDYIGYYNISSELNVEDNTANLVILVTITNNEKNSNIPEEIKEMLESSSNYNDVSDENDLDDNIEITTTQVKTTSKEEEKEKEKEQEEKEQEEHNKKSNMIGIILFSTIGLVLLIAILYATIKIIKANK